MANITTAFNITDNNGNILRQADVEFVNLYLGQDNKFFMDYNKIHSVRGDIRNNILEYLASFFHELSNAVLFNNDIAQHRLLFGIHESNSTFLGMSRGNPSGNSIGPILRRLIRENLNIFRDMINAGHLDLNSVSLAIPNIGDDRCSDTIISVAKSVFIEFTIQQSLIHNIPLSDFVIDGIYNKDTFQWERRTVQLPPYEGKPVIFIPKQFVSKEKYVQRNLNKFITHGFNSYFKTSATYINLIRGNESQEPLSRTELIEYFKSVGITRKNIAQKMFLEMPNEQIVNIFGDIHNNIQEITDEEIEEILEIFRLAS